MKSTILYSKSYLMLNVKDGWWNSVDIGVPYTYNTTVTFSASKVKSLKLWLDSKNLYKTIDEIVEIL